MTRTFFHGNNLRKKDKGYIFLTSLIILILFSSLAGILISFEKAKIMHIEKKSARFYSELEKNNETIKEEAKIAAH